MSAAPEASCRALISGLRVVAHSVLPRGWSVVPFGSYVQGTAVDGSALDVALVPDVSETGFLDSADAAAAVEALCAALTSRTTNFLVAPQSIPGAGPVRLLAGDFSKGLHDVKHEVLIFVGDASTGRIDVMLAQLLDADPRARVFVRLVKSWARSRGLAGPLPGGSFPWTLLAVLALQRLGALPSLAEICRATEAAHGPASAAAPRSPWPIAADACSMLLQFARTTLDIQAQRLPRADLWAGTLTPAGGPRVDARTAGALGGLLPAGRPVAAELRRLWQATEARAGLRPPLPLSVAALQTPPRRPQGDRLATGASAEKSRPEATDTAEDSPLVKSGGEMEPEEAACSYSMSADAAPFVPGANLPTELGALVGASLSFPAVLPVVSLPAAVGNRAGAFFPLPSFEDAGDAVEAPAGDTSGRASRRMVVWRLSSDWVAVKWMADAVLETVRLDPSLAEGRSVEEWEKRFNRREHRIKVVKATREYRNWNRDYRQRGAPGEPLTPPVPVQTSNRAFECALYDWKVQLHQVYSTA